MGWPTKTNCDNTPRPTLGNPASLLPYVYRPAPMSAQASATFCNLPASVAPVVEAAPMPIEPVPAAVAVAPTIPDDTQQTKAPVTIILIDPDDPAYDEP